MFDPGLAGEQEEPFTGLLPNGVSADPLTQRAITSAKDVDSALELAERAQPAIGSLAGLLAIDPRNLDPEDAVRFLQGLERHLGWLHSIQAIALVSAAGEDPETTDAQIYDPERRGADPGIRDISREEIACATGWGSGHAQHRIDVARVLCGSLPRVMEALSSGQFGYAHAAAIADAAEQLPGYGDPDQREGFAQACALLEERVIKTALSSSVTRTRRAAARAAVQIADLDLSHRKQTSKLAHHVTLVDDPDGSSTLTARMPSHHAHACMAAIRHLANHPMLDLPCDASVGQRRAFALATLVIGPRPEGPLQEELTRPPVSVNGAVQETAPRPRRQRDRSIHPHDRARVSDASQADQSVRTGAISQADPPGQVCVELPKWPEGMSIAPRPKVHLDLVISLEALLGLSDQHASIPGAGHVPADIVRGLLDDATMRRMVTDPMTGHLLDLGRRTYRIPAAVRRFIEARDQTCRFPGCNRRAIHCEIDHAIAWSDGGQTSPGNLGALCTRHHRIKTHTTWTIQDSDPGGACIWTSPHGRTYSHHPPPPLEPLTRPRPAGLEERSDSQECSTSPREPVPADPDVDPPPEDWFPF